jgi:hypothetical protein
MLFASFKYSSNSPKWISQHTTSQNKHEFPVIVRLDVENEHKNVQAVYKLVGVYYRSTNKIESNKETMLCISAIDNYGIEFKFEWTSYSNVKEPSFARIPSKFFGEEVVSSSEKRSKTLCYKTHLVKNSQHFLAEGLVYILCPTQDNVFRSNENTARVSNFVHFDVINESNSVPFNMHALKRLNSDAWLDDNVVNYFGFSMRDYFNCPRNILISSLSFAQLANTDVDKILGFNKFSKLLKNQDDLFSNPDLVIHIPVNIGQNHWIYVYVSFKDKQICFCDSLSTGANHFSIASTILEFLEHEHKQRLNSGSSKSTFVIGDWDRISKRVPTQTDGFSCGVFVILFMFRMMKNVMSNIFLEFNYNKTFTPSEMNKVRKAMIEIVFKRAQLEDLESFL